MANELTVTANLAGAKSGISISSIAAGVAYTMTGAIHYVHRTQAIGTSAEALDTGDITTVGWAWFKNHDATDSISIRNGSAGADVAKLKPGEVAVFRAAANALHAVASANTPKLEYLLFED